MVNSVSFRRGDIVQLNSGGPRMIVDAIEEGAIPIVRCRWYEGRELHVDRFYIDGLHHFQMAAANAI